MDPFSISTGVLAFTSVSIKVLMGLKQFRDSVKEASTSINALISDISALRRVLLSMEETFQDTEDEQVLQQTGHIGTHWQNLHQCLSDGHDALSEFDAMLVDLNKSVRVLDETRRELRIQSAASRIALFRQQVQAYKDTLQMCLQAIILWNSVSIQKTATRIEPNLEAIHKEIRRLATNVEVKIQAIQDLVMGSTETDAVKDLVRLNQCIDSAASVLSSASTILGFQQSWDDDDLESIHTGSKRIDVVEWINRGETGEPSADIAPLPNLPELAGGYVPDFTSPTLSVAADKATLPASTAEPIFSEAPVHMYKAPQGGQAWSPSLIPQLTPAEHNSHQPPFGISAPSPPTAHAASMAETQVQVPPESPPNVQVKPDSEHESRGAEDNTAMAGTKTATEAETAIIQPHKRMKSGSRLSRFLSVRWKFQSRSSSSPTKPPSGARASIRFGRRPNLRRKFVFVGDGACGKTCLLIVTSKGTFPDVYVPTVFENYVADVPVHGIDGSFEVALWDTAGQEDYDRIRPLSYPDAHALIMCFAIDSPDSLINIGEKWHAEGIHFLPNVPIFVVGCKQDLRYDAETISRLRRRSQQPVSTTEGLAIASLINARCYIETSARTKHGINSVFSVITDEILRTPEVKNERFLEEDYDKICNEISSPASHRLGPSTPTIRRFAERYSQFESGYPDPLGATTWRLGTSDSGVEKGSTKLAEPARPRSRLFWRAA
ncbi:hypothetical protein QBC34DRAFT_66989 [Podospora aff. communis PSN243]|uniref:Azaphilone pigments biosynthesis cluster protein L N-terminal domain-containing protein n=1 Tax=Podospora aff. communis PSN243 TaxID=3040156 RepID=A0AAV9H5U9_9PEZI|nr:hypothetical protein QBC34DRAFT_66989 [Podospora aff. communis PSN243]